MLLSLKPVNKRLVATAMLFFETDVQGCIAFLDLYVECDYTVQTDARVAALTQGVTEGRDGKGIVYMFSAGNEFKWFEDINFEAPLYSRFTITYV